MSESVLSLPSPLELGMPLVRALGHRRSVRSYAPDALDPKVLAALLWATAGQSDAKGHRTAPSAHDVREIDAYVIDASGVWRYDSSSHSLTCLCKDDVRAKTTLMQDFVLVAPVTICLCLDTKKAEPLKPARAPYIVHIDAGCMLQNGLLAATAMGLGSVVRASFDADVLHAAMHLPETARPLICFTVGLPGSEA